jgi:hypothetical protein
MRAAALAGRGQGPRPDAVSDAIACERLGVPLAAGGLLEQPFGRTQRMLAAQTVYDAFRLYANSPLSDVEFSRRFPEAWEVVTHIESSAFDA